MADLLTYQYSNYCDACCVVSVSVNPRWLFAPSYRLYRCSHLSYFALTSHPPPCSLRLCWLFLLPSLFVCVWVVYYWRGYWWLLWALLWRLWILLLWSLWKWDCLYGRVGFVFYFGCRNFSARTWLFVLFLLIRLLLLYLWVTARWMKGVGAFGCV